jgi:hypothetical protein
MNNKFIQDNIDIVKVFEELSLVKDYGRLQSLIPELMKEYSQCVPSIVNKLNSSFGIHRVYVANVKIKTGDRFIKIGYTKNTVKQRLSEGRYKGKIYLIDVIHEEFFPALGSKEFESKLITSLEKYNVTNENIEAPGKGELFFPEHEDKILEKYDELKDKSKHKRGFKSAN